MREIKFTCIPCTHLETFRNCCENCISPHFNMTRFFFDDLYIPTLTNSYLTTMSYYRTVHSDKYQRAPPPLPSPSLG